MLIHERTKRKLRERNKVQEFANNINMTIVNNIYYELCSMEDSSNYTVDSVNTLVEKICDLYSSSCIKSFGDAKQTNPVTCNVKRNLSWFDKKCNAALKKFNRAKCMYKLNKSKANKYLLNSSSKAYKQI